MFQWCWIQPRPLWTSQENTGPHMGHHRAHSGERQWQMTGKAPTHHRGSWPETLTASPLHLKEKLWFCRRANDHFPLAISFSILHLAKPFFANYLLFGWHKHNINFSSLLILFPLFQTSRQTVSESIYFFLFSVTSVGLIKCTTFISQSPVSIISLDL